MKVVSGVAETDASRRLRPDVTSMSALASGDEASMSVGLAEVVGDDPLIAVAIGGAEVLVDHLADPQPVAANRFDGDDLRLEPLVVVTTTDHTGGGEQRCPANSAHRNDVTPRTDLAQHGRQSALLCQELGSADQAIQLSSPVLLDGDLEVCSGQ